MRLYLLAPVALFLTSCVNDTAKIRQAALYTGKSAVAVLADQQEIVTYLAGMENAGAKKDVQEEQGHER